MEREWDAEQWAVRQAHWTTRSRIKVRHQCRVVESCSGVWWCPKCKRLVGRCHGGSEPPDWCDDCWVEGSG
jgi:hypothetical protein